MNGWMNNITCRAPPYVNVMHVCGTKKGTPHTNSSNNASYIYPNIKASFQYFTINPISLAITVISLQVFYLARWILLAVFEISNISAYHVHSFGGRKKKGEKKWNEKKKETERLERLCCLLTASGKTNQDNKHLWASGTDTRWQNPYGIWKLHLNEILKMRTRKIKSSCFSCGLQKRVFWV